MKEMDPKARIIIQLVLTLTGLVMIVAGLLLFSGVFQLDGLEPQNVGIVSYVLIGVGFSDLILSWFLFRK